MYTIKLNELEKAINILKEKTNLIIVGTILTNAIGNFVFKTKEKIYYVHCKTWEVWSRNRMTNKNIEWQIY